MDAAPGDMKAPLSEVEPRLDRWSELFAEMGVRSKRKRAGLLGVDRRTYDRWLQRRVTPTLESALRAAKNLDTTVNELWKLPEEPK